MDDVIEDRLSMFEKVFTFLTQNSAALTPTAIIGSHIYGAFNAKLQAILLEAGDAGAPTTGQTEAKHQLRNQVETKGLALSGAGFAYFTIAVNNTTKRSYCRFTKTDLDAKRDNDLYADMKKMHQTVEPVKASLGPYGFSDVQVDEYADLLSDFLADIQKPRDAIAARSASNKQLVRLMDEMSVIIEEQLDPVMLYYSLNNVELYDYYKGARGIDQSGGGAQPDEDTSVTLAPFEFLSTDQTQEFTGNTRIVIDHSSPSAAVLNVSFSSGQNSTGPQQRTINPGDTLDITAGEIGFGLSNNWFNVYNTGSPVNASVTFRIRVYY